MRRSPSAVNQAFADIVEAAKASVVRIDVGSRGVGTGIIWRSDAARSEVITNAHVVAGLTRRNSGGLRIVTADDRSFAAQLLAGDPQLDLALLGLAVGGLPTARIGDSARLRVGELVFAIGNPWGQAGVVTAGVISGLGSMAIRGTRRIAPYIRSDVLLAPGNSGGPLLNAAGAVIGVNAMIFGGDLSVAIPSHVVAEWIADNDRL
ncbi:MAG: S1C family serine protease [Thermoflexales bacterium]